MWRVNHLRCRDVGKGWMDGNVGSTSSQRIFVWSTNLPFSPGKNCVTAPESWSNDTVGRIVRYLFRKMNWSRRRKCTTVPSWIKREMHKDVLRQIPHPNVIRAGAFRAAEAGRGFPSKGLWWADIECRGSGQGNRGKPPNDTENFGCQASLSWLQEPSTPCSTRQEENQQL